MNLRLFLLVCLVFAGFLISCASSEKEERAEKNRQQLEALRKVQHRRNLVRQRILSHAVVKSARIHFPPGQVIAEIKLKSRAEMGEATWAQLIPRLKRLRSDVNAFVTQLTGVSKESISLRVSPSD